MCQIETHKFPVEIFLEYGILLELNFKENQLSFQQIKHLNLKAALGFITKKLIFQFQTSAMCGHENEISFDI